MTSVTQTIPNYIAGISQQPDQFKNPGQVSDAVNVVPDITQGLVKRPGSKLISTLPTLSSAITSTWFHYYRDATEQYIGQIQRSTGVTEPVIKIWNCLTGVESTVQYGKTWVSGSSYTAGDIVRYGTTNYKAKLTHNNVTTIPSSDSTNWETNLALQNYIKHGSLEDLQFLTVNDYTYICNRTKAVTLISTSTTPTGPANHYAFIDLKKTENARQYSLNLYNSNTATDNLRTVTRLKHIGGPQARNIDVQGGGTGYLVYDSGNAATDYSVTMTGSSTSSTQSNPGGWSGKARNTGSSTGPITQLVTLARGDDLRPTSTITIAAPPSGTTATGYINEWNPSHTAYPSGATNEGKWQGTCDDISTEVHHSGEAGVEVYELTAASGNTPRSYAKQTRNSDNTWGSGVNKRKNLLWRMTISGQSGINPGNDGTGANHYVCSYNYDLDLLHGGEGWKEGDIVVYKQKGNDTSRIFFLEIEKVETTSLKCTVRGTAGDGWIRPEPTPFDADTAVTATSILGGIKTEIDAITGTPDIAASIIGNGLYLSSTAAFNIETGEFDLMNILTDEVNDVAKLPVQCKHGYIVKIVNSESDEDDYYMKFVGDNDLDGSGSWIECANPGIIDSIHPASFPVQLVRQSSGSFILQQTKLGKRDVGDNTTNPIPSFVSLRTTYGDDVDEDRFINKVLFWRNRLVLLSGTNVICSQPGEGNITDPNFWAKTALTVSATDAIDLSCSSTEPATLFDGIEVPSGLLLFSANHQFLLTHDSEVLNPETAKTEPLSTYNYNTAIAPISLGTSIGFIDNAGKNSRFFEVTNAQRTTIPDILDQSASIPTLLPKDINLLAASKENTYVLAAVEGQSDIYGYKYFDSGQKRLQSAWFRWKLRTGIKYHTIIDDSYYVVDANNNLLKFDLKINDNTALLDNTAISYPIHLDQYKSFPSSTFTFLAATGTEPAKTIFSMPTGYSSLGTLVAYDDTANTTTTESFGRYAEAAYNTTTSRWELPGDWTDNSIYLGYVYDMEVHFPTIYMSKNSETRTVNDLHASLTVHRIKLSLGNIGRYKTLLNRIGRDTYEELIEPTIQDAYKLGSAPIDEDRVYTVPVYDRNINATLTLKSSHPAPATLLSMSWEGDYTDKYYKRA